MTRAEARVILDCVKLGDDFPAHLVELALVLTGDLAPTNWRLT